MKAYIIKGNQFAKDAYINKYIEENKVANYNLIKFDENLKINDSREIKKIISKNSFTSGKRLIIINGDPTIEAQNALLKILEELDDETDFIFSTNSDLLPTIQSRSFLIKVGEIINSNDISSNTDFVDQLFNSKNIGQNLILLDNFFKDNNIDSYSELILEMRRSLLNKLFSDNFNLNNKKYKFLKLLNSKYPLVKINNMNPKLTAERILLSIMSS